MNKVPGVSYSIGLLDELQRTAAKFAAHETEIEKTRRSETAAAIRESREKVEDAQRKLNQDIERAQNFFPKEKERLEEAREARIVRIRKAYQDTRKSLVDEVESKKGREIAGLQAKILDAKRGLQSGAAEAEAAFNEFHAESSQEKARQRKLLKLARAALRGNWQHSRALMKKFDEGVSDIDYQKTELELLEQSRRETDIAEEKIKDFATHPGPKLFGVLPIWATALIGAVVGAAVTNGMAGGAADWGIAGGIVLVFSAVHFVVHRLVWNGVSNEAEEITRSFTKARQLLEVSRENAQVRYERQVMRLKSETEKVSTKADEKWKEEVDEAGEKRGDILKELDKRRERALKSCESLFAGRIKALEGEPGETIEKLRVKAQSVIEGLNSECVNREAAAKTAFESAKAKIETDWGAEIGPIYEKFAALQKVTSETFEDWTPEYCEGWKPPTEFAHAGKFARIDVDTSKLVTVPKADVLALPEPTKLEVPLSVSLPREGSLLFETDSSAKDVLIDTLNNVVLRLLSKSPPGKLGFTIIDPVGLGQNFAGLTHLADFEDSVINARIWTQRGQIEERLSELNDHMEKIIQMYLRNEYQTIFEYNEEAGNIAEKYQFVVIADFPASFSDVAAKRLLSIAASGARCGIYTLIHWDRRRQLPEGFEIDDLREHSHCFECDGEEYYLMTDEFGEGAKLVFDRPPDADLARTFVQRVGQASVDSNRVEVPFSHVAPPDGDYWSGDTTSELRVPIGRTGATKLQYLAIGKGTRQHALFAGKTGSGKSTLFHVIITNLALHCSPEQVEFYLIDFKKGVEFKCYGAKKLPHAKVVAIESDREFGLSVLSRVDEELKRRGEMFRALGVQDIAGYKAAGGKEPVPRSLLIIDEFQEFFTEDDRIAQNASVLLDRIVRQGRAFGIHVLLGSQTLGGAYTLARTTMGQMVIRVALQCNEADALLIMDDDNPAPRLLTRPGEGIYNDSAGAIEGNSPFQTVWISENERDEWLDKACAMAVEKGKSYPAPIVFEGNAPADVRDNEALAKMLASEPSGRPALGRAFLGAPNSIKGPTEAVFQRQSGSNLLVVGQRDESALAITGVGLLSLAAQYPTGAAEFVIFDGTTPETPEQSYLDAVINAIPHPVARAKNNDATEIMQALTEEVKRREDDAHLSSAPEVFVVALGVQKFKKLRFEEDFGFSMDDDDEAGNPGQQLNDLIASGPSAGIHILATIDSYNNINRCLSRKALSEFEMRVVFQMSANDSASLIDAPDAGSLGLHRAIFYNEQEGVTETFRPYATPDQSWLSDVREKMGELAVEATA
ncbi:MAG: FtsK/SpoIIIE domain-containing protein [Verrucomicrobiota bacterium]